MFSGRWGERGDGNAPPARWRALTTTLPLLLMALSLASTAVAPLPTAAPTSLTPAANVTSPTVGPLVVDGQLTLVGQPFVPRGFNMIGLLAPGWCTTGQGLQAAAHFGQPELDAARAWNANTLRFQVSQRGLADPGMSSAERDAYLSRVADGVRLARSNGFFVIVSLQDQSNSCGPAHPLPTDMSMAAWQVLAPALMNDRGVMFELFNEPNVDTTAAGWAQWRDGGPGPTTNLGDTPIGHQALVELLRGLGATNVLIVDGVKKAASLEGLTPLSDPTAQLMYAVHPYYFDPGVSWWDRRFGAASASFPVIATEWNFKADGCGTTKETLADDLLAYLRLHRIGMLAHAFDVPGTTITSDWAWTPTDCAGSEGGSGLLTRNYFSGQSDPDIQVGEVPTPTAVVTAVDSVRLEWQAASGPVAQYDVLRDGSVVATTTHLRFDDTGLALDTVYHYQVRAVDESGEPGPASDEVVVRTPAGPDVDPPAAPSLLQVTDLTTEHVGLSWQPSTDNVGVAAYEVRRDGAAIGATDGLTCSFTDNTVSAGTSYGYTVVAVDAAGNVGPSSDLAVATVPVQDTSPPTTPTGLVANWSASGVSLTWDANSSDDTGVTGYLVERDGSTIGSSAGTAFSDSAPLEPGSYTYVVKAADAAGNISEGSSPAVVVVPAPPDTSPPSVPTQVTAAVLSATTSRVMWTASSDDTAVTEYRVTRDGVTIAAVANTSFVDPAMPADATHVYRVAAVDAAGNVSAPSTAASVTAPAAAPKGLTGRYFDTASFGSLKLTRVDPTLNFAWGTSAPAAGMGADTFSVRWSGNILPVSTETYTFYLQSDEGARLWVNGRLLVDDWTWHSLRERQGTIALAPTQAYTIKVELREKTMNAAVRLTWSTQSITKTVIPTAQLLAS